MNSFWNHAYDPVKDQRYARLFLSALAVFFGLLFLGASILEATQQAPEGTGLFLLGVTMWCRVTVAFRRARARRGEILPRAPLSRDELRAARSKLLKDRNRLML